jgi:8-oxo-dGTP pyrophosphatase MutT (NUDIX family)
VTDDHARAWTIRNTSVLSHNPYFSVVQQAVESTDGSLHDYYIVHFDRPAVGILPTRGSDVLLIRQYRFIVDELVWALPSGGVTDGETLQQAAARELQEETGYMARELQPWLGCYASYGCSNQRFEIFLAKDVQKIPDCGFDPAEVLSVKWFSRDELKNLVETNGVVDNLSLSPLLLFLLKTQH